MGYKFLSFFQHTKKNREETDSTKSISNEAINFHGCGSLGGTFPFSSAVKDGDSASRISSRKKKWEFIIQSIRKFGHTESVVKFTVKEEKGSNVSEESNSLDFLPISCTENSSDFPLKAECSSNHEEVEINSSTDVNVNEEIVVRHKSGFQIHFLPRKCIENILCRLSPADVTRVSCVNSALNTFSISEVVWNKITPKYCKSLCEAYDIKRHCHHQNQSLACFLNLSQGNFFGSAKLILLSPLTGKLCVRVGIPNACISVHSANSERPRKITSNDVYVHSANRRFKCFLPAGNYRIYWTIRFRNDADSSPTNYLRFTNLQNGSVARLNPYDIGFANSVVARRIDGGRKMINESDLNIKKLVEGNIVSELTVDVFRLEPVSGVLAKFEIECAFLAVCLKKWRHLLHVDSLRVEMI